MISRGIWRHPTVKGVCFSHECGWSRAPRPPADWPCRAPQAYQEREHLVDQSQLIAIIATAIRDVRVDYPAIEPGIAHESVPFAKAVLDALDKAGLKIVPKDTNG
jgi:hypothetical protein